MLDFDATPITAQSDKEGAAGHYKGGLGFNLLLVSCGQEVLAMILRPGNAGANNAADHLDLFELALEQLPPRRRWMGRSSRARTRPAPATRWPTRDAKPPSGSPSATRSTRACAMRSWPCPKPRGGRRSTATTSRATVRGWPS
jgi:hypothetical protein